MIVMSDACTIHCVMAVAFALTLARVINYAPRVMIQIVASLTDDSRGVLMFKEQATNVNKK